MKEQNVNNIVIDVLSELVRTNKISMEDISIALDSLRTKRMKEAHAYLRSENVDLIKPQSSSQQLKEYLKKMTCPSAARDNQPTATQPSDLEDHKPKNK